MIWGENSFCIHADPFIVPDEECVFIRLLALLKWHVVAVW